MPLEVKTEIRVRFNECDFYQHVNNASYMVYLDVAILDYFREVYKEIKTFDSLFHLVHATLDFKNPATFDDELIITTYVEKTGTTSITFKQKIHKKTTGEIVVEAKKIGVFLDIKTQTKCNVPEILKQSAL